MDGSTTGMKTTPRPLCTQEPCQETVKQLPRELLKPSSFFPQADFKMFRFTRACRTWPRPPKRINTETGCLDNARAHTLLAGPLLDELPEAPHMNEPERKTRNTSKHHLLTQKLQAHWPGMPGTLAPGQTLAKLRQSHPKSLETRI